MRTRNSRTIKLGTLMKIRTNPKIRECRWECKASHHVEIRTTKFGFRQNWKLSAAFRLVRINKVFARNLTNNTKIVHFTQNFDILRKIEGDGHFPIRKLVDLSFVIWYNCNRLYYLSLTIILFLGCLAESISFCFAMET